MTKNNLSNAVHYAYRQWEIKVFLLLLLDVDLQTIYSMQIVVFFPWLSLQPFWIRISMTMDEIRSGNEKTWIFFSFLNDNEFWWIRCWDQWEITFAEGVHPGSPRLIFSLPIFHYRRNSTGITIAGKASAGNNSTQLNRPQAIFLDYLSKLLYVADSVNKRIQRFSIDPSISMDDTVLSNIQSISGF